MDHATLIDLVRQFPIIYDKGNKNFKDKNMRKNAWETIASILNVDDGKIPNYYWRDYHGVIPSDAVPGGRDINHRKTFIGQAFVNYAGIIPGTIYPGIKEVFIPYKGCVTVDCFIKILCSPFRDFFQWMPVKSDELHLKSINRHLVEGGMEYNKVLYIGRVADNNEVVIGKICTENPQNTPLWYLSKKTEKRVNSCEVLIYEYIPFLLS